MISKGKHSHKVKHGTIDNDMTSDKIPSDDEYFEQMLDEEESRSLPGQWIVAAQYILFSTISSYLQTADQHGLERDMTLTEAKDRIRHSVLAQTARIIIEIDTYPDIANVENWYLSHDQLRKLFDDESKKC